MVENMLPKTINPLRMAKSQVELSGCLELAAMSRLGEVIERPTQQVKIHLTFGYDEQRRVVISGQIKTTVELQCQRCLQPFKMAIARTIALGAVTSDAQAKMLPKSLEPLVLSEPSIALVTLIEDELLLALPIIPKHPLAQCQRPRGSYSSESEGFQKQSPFQKLAEVQSRRQK